MSVDFVDSNIFIYLLDETNPRKRDTARQVVRTALAEGSACISHQVIQETLQVMTGKLKVPVTFEDARRFLEETLVPLWRVMPSTKLYQRSLEVQQRYRYGFYDSLIIAAALEGGCRRLLSEDFQHGQQIEGLRIEDPFREL
jgi:predicted nucleic acid-binding protein